MDSGLIIKDDRKVDELAFKILKYLRPDLNPYAMGRLYEESFRKLKDFLSEGIENING